MSQKKYRNKKSPNSTERWEVNFYKGYLLTSDFASSHTAKKKKRTLQILWFLKEKRIPLDLKEIS